MHDRADCGPLDAVLVGYEEQENLGLRSVQASLAEAGFEARIVQFAPEDPREVLEIVAARRPALVGLSVIFQYALDTFAKLAAALRAAGCRAHLTAGGHFPSLRPRDVLEAVPELDSIVRFEGERTAVELMSCLDRPEEWVSIAGLAFRSNGTVVVNPPRPLISDLDSLPLPVRDSPRRLTRGIPVAFLVASRGCLYDCSFCSIRQFYGSAPGPLRRTRSARAVVAEMKALHERDGVRFFIFQDDDFAARSPQQRAWLGTFLEGLDESGLAGRVAWKVSCRVDDVDPQIFSLCRDRGLLTVYLGVESGSPASLKVLHKRATVDDGARAIAALKQIGLAYDMGFMLLDPGSTFATVRENIEFLRRTTADGSCPADFAKMLPYAGTPIEASLQEEGRLRGTATRPDYEFLDPRLDMFELFVARVFRDRSLDALGVLERLRIVRFDELLSSRFCPDVDSAAYRSGWEHLTARANRAALNALEDGLRFMEERDARDIEDGWEGLGDVARSEWEEEIAVQRGLDELLAIHCPELRSAFAREVSHRCTTGGSEAVPFSILPSA
jgi:radical SAM superfamily enzyme YgiQ (UPF0313 family)